MYSTKTFNMKGKNQGNMRKTSIIFLLLMFLLPIKLCSQGIFLEKGKDGFGFLGGYFSNEDVSGFGFYAGMTKDAFIDLGLSINRGSFKEKENDNLEAIEISPSVEFHLLKESEKLPFSLSLGGSYFYQHYSNDFLDDLDLKMKSKGFSWSSDIYKTLYFSDNINIIPMFGISRSYSEGEISDDSEVIFSEDVYITNYSFGIFISFKNESGNIFLLNSALSLNDENTTVGFSLGFVIPDKQ